MIELKNLTKHFYQKNRKVIALSDVSLTVPAGKIYGIIGASGAGKSTLIRCINLLERPSAGEVIVNGKTLTRLPRKQLTIERRFIGMIFQHFNLLSSRTIFDNIAFPLELTHTPKQEIQERVNSLLELVGLTDKAHDYPASLSGGQKQRVAIARTLASRPAVLLCDEATSALDPATTKSILALLKDINRRLGITILLITHEMEVVKSICDFAGILQHGQLIEQGATSQLFAHPKTAVAQEFIASTLHFEIPDAYRTLISAVPGPGKHPLVKLQFAGNVAHEDILFEASTQYRIKTKTIRAHIESLDTITFGVILLEWIGEAQDCEQALRLLEKNKIKVEVIGYV